MKRFYTLPSRLPFLKASLAAVGVRALTALAVGKWIALGFGPAGTAFFGQLMNLFGTFAALPHDGLARAMVKAGASALGQEDKAGERRVLHTSLSLLLVFFVVEVALIGFLTHFTSLLSPLFHSQNWLGFSLAFCLLIGLYVLTHTFLIRRKNLWQVGTHIALALGGVAGFGLARVFHQGLEKSLLFFLIGQFVAGAAVASIGLRRLHIPLGLKSYNWANARMLSNFALAVAGSGFLNMMGLYGLTFWLLTKIGQEEVGIWMAMNRLADVFNMPILAVANSILLPMLSGMNGQRNLLRQTMAPLFRHSLWALAFGFFAFSWLYPYLLHLFFSPAYNTTAFRTSGQLIGDFFKSSTYLFSILILALGHTRFYLLIEVFSLLLLLLGAALIVPVWGAEGLYFLHGMRYLVYWAILVHRYRDILI